MSFARSLRERAATAWEDGYRHPFVQELGQGTLALERFRFYLLQDYQYLLSYAKMFALAVTKTNDEALMTKLTSIQHTILTTEMALHKGYLTDFGVSREQVLKAKPSLYAHAYTAHMLSVAQTGDLAEVLAALLPCAWTYADYAQRLKKDYAEQLSGNPYRRWIELYADPGFARSYEWFYSAIDTLAIHKTDAQRERIAEAFTLSVEFEYLFWDMSYKQELSYPPGF